MKKLVFILTFSLLFSSCMYSSKLEEKLGDIEIMQSEGEHEKVILEYSKMIKEGIKFDSLDQEAGVYINRANSKQQLGLQKEALEDYDMALQILPDAPEAYANRGILYDKQGDYKKAMHDYRRALKLKPELGEGPGIIRRVLFNIQEKPATIAGRLKFLEETSADSNLNNDPAKPAEAKQKEISDPGKKG